MNVARWYIDADTLGLAQVLVAVRRDVTFPGDTGVRPVKSRQMAPCVVTRTDTPDEVWIPVVTRAGMAIITRDQRIRERTSEKDAVVACGARMFAITSNERPLDVWKQLEIVVSQWRAMEAHAAAGGPFIYAVSRTSMSQVDLLD